MNIDEKTVEDLIDELTKASKKYYQDLEESDLSDDEFDAKINSLEEFRKDFPNLFSKNSKGFMLLEGNPSLGTRPEGKQLVPHQTPMLSLGKAKEYSELRKFLNKLHSEGARKFTLQAKLDGFALSVKYSQGQIEYIATRGDGVVGEDMTYLADADRLTISGLPTALEHHNELELRGEVFFTNQQFQNADDSRFKNFGTRFKNSRNAAVGLLKKAKKGLDYDVTLTFSTYAALDHNEYIDLSELENENIETVDHLTKTQISETPYDNTIISDIAKIDHVIDAVKEFQKHREEFSIPTDGVVIKPSNESEMRHKLGDTSHHPSSQIAFKYPGLSAITHIVAIRNTVGKTGKLTPVAVIKPVDLAGTTITNISLHNYNWISERDVREGSIVEVTRANDVIPYLKQVITVGANNQTMPPQHCPHCNTKLINHGDENPSKVITCPNYECESRQQFLLRTAVGKNYLNIDGLSEVLLDHLYATKRITNIADLYTLTVDEMKDMPLGVSTKGNPRKLGEKRAKNIVHHIEKSKTAPLHKLMSALGVSTLGSRMSKELIKEFGTFDKIRSAAIEEISALDQFGEVRAREVVDGLARCSNLIDELISKGVVFDDESTSVDTGDKFKNHSFAISGPVPESFGNRQEWIAYIEDNGGEFHSSPKKNTSFMIADKNDSSSKIIKALKLGIDFMTAEDFTKNFVNS